ncbi:hypothetical protein SAMD00019534_104130 [Acytostelium subglobosum LB1]|uniref:hypothetical protein n=1 Tax=Acytostelium subglobosum LB1 TaxID=1410327 RepID=UPI000644C6EE|nr:hypothetical protein SAMD00019534_104130 [Acytostelium subglobosum LB1]GAM27238.1 hypothetical protein SAMD00019534_104130 [Acytostelium subglobosum LB1]|eukprot:XP_012749705.1 hypothetical protein SAMD00019534_104130 [Acytostelium subglobosum LB1]
MVICTNFNFITKLNLNDNLIKEIPPDIYKLRALKVFWINNNRLSSIPDEVGLLSELEDFQADGNHVAKIHKVFFELKKIDELSLARNQLRELPAAELNMLRSLRTLSLEDNQLTILPALAGLISLRTLNAASNHIEYIFADFVHCHQLANLSLACNRLTTLPDSFGTLRTLTVLNLRSNRLHTLPESFGRLTSLTTLLLWDNSFEHFPVCLTQCTALTELSLANNRLTDVPAEIGALTNLRKLYLQYNDIERLPVELKYLRQLSTLLLHHNRLQSIPCEISLLKYVESLNLTGNPLPARLLQGDLAVLLKHLHCELLHRREICARVIQRHYRAWRRQYRFRSIVYELMDGCKQQRIKTEVSKDADKRRAAIKIQRWYRSRRIINAWHGLVSKAMLLSSTRLQQASHEGRRLGSIFGFDEPDSERNIVYTYGPQKIIRFATIAKLVEHLTYTTYQEAGFATAFFATCSSFIPCVELFQLLCVRYHAEPPLTATASELATFRKMVRPRIQERVIEMIGHWIKNHLNDFETNATLLRNFNSFLLNTLMLEKETSARRLIAIFNETKKKSKDDLEELIKFVNNAPKPYLPLRPTGPYTLLELSTIEVARQMALIDHTMLTRISAHELLSKRWSTVSDECPNIKNMIHVFNNGSQWIASEIVMERKSKIRRRKLKFFLDVARLCFEMCNYNSLMMIVSGLISSSVGRLKGTWGALSSRRREQFDDMTRTMNMEGNYRQYRILLSETKGPCIPFFGLYLQDLTFMEEGNPTFINGLLNFVKKRLEANLVNKFMAFKQTPFCFAPVSFIQDIILNTPVLTEAQLYEKSTAIEKRHMKKIIKRTDRERQLTMSTSSNDLAGDLLLSPSKLRIDTTSTTTTTSLSSPGKKSRRHRDSTTLSSPPSSPVSISVSHSPVTPLNLSSIRSPPSSTSDWMKKGDAANTSSPAILTSPANKVPSLDFSISSQLQSVGHSPLYHSVDHSTPSSPSITSRFKQSPLSSFNPIRSLNNLAFPPSLVPRSPRDSPRGPRIGTESPRNESPRQTVVTFDVSPIHSPYNERR